MFLDSSDFREGVMNESSRMVTGRKIKKKGKLGKRRKMRAKGIVRTGPRGRIIDRGSD